jgi:putative ABC transport system permease protein
LLKNFILVAWRNLLKNRTLSVINLVGLSLSVAFCLLLLFYIRNEQSYDSFHQKKDRLFRMEMTNLFPPANPKPKDHLFSFFTEKEDVENEVIVPLIVGRDIQHSFPEVKSITRFQDQEDQLVKVNNQTFKQPHVLYADNTFFTNFSFQILKGDPKTVLNSIHGVVLSASVAKKYFGNEEAVGKTIELLSDSTRLFTVSGIAEDAPANSSIQYGIVFPLQSDPSYERDINRGFESGQQLLILELGNGVSVELFQQKINRWMKTYFTDYIKGFKDANINNFHWYLRPLADCHYNISPHWGHYTDLKNIYQLVCLMVVIILIASLNYVLLAISGAAGRSGEVSVRKVMGANKRSVILQFWVEAQIVVIFSVVVGLVLCRIFLPFFNQTMNTRIFFNDFSLWEVGADAAILCLSLGIFAGYYPARLLSKMKPVSILNGFRTYKINPRFFTVLVVLQYTVCVVLMICAFVINRQMHYIHNKNLGFDKEQVLIVKNPTYDFAFTKKLKERLYDFAQSQPSIIQYSGMNGSLDGSYNTNGFILNGEQEWRSVLTVDYNYFDMLGLKILKGRAFSRSFPTDTVRKQRPVVVNDALFSMLGKSAKLGEYNEALDATIIGVVKDYNVESLTRKINPVEHRLTQGYVTNFMFKVKPGKMQPAISNIEKEWKEITSNYPFEYTFLDQTIAKMYEEDTRWQTIIQASCFFAILIACLGLFGLSAINAINRNKEIGIRKVLGASIADIVSILSKKFILWVGASIVIAIPLAGWMMNKWLEEFAYRIRISWWMFVLVGIMALAIAFFTISYQAIKAAVRNPVWCLREM